MRKCELERGSQEHQDLRNRSSNLPRKMRKAIARERIAVPEVCGENQAPEKGGVLGQECTPDVWLPDELLPGLVPATGDAEAEEDDEGAEGCGVGLLDGFEEEDDGPGRGSPVPEVVLFLDVAAGEHHYSVDDSDQRENDRSCWGSPQNGN